MVVGAKVCELTDGFLWFLCGSYVGILTSPLIKTMATLSTYLKNQSSSILLQCD